MKQLIVGPNDAGQRLDRFLAKTAPLLPGALAQKYIRLKRVRVNGVTAKRDTRLAEGDKLELYIGDEFFCQPDKDNAYLAVSNPDLEIVYEDNNIILCDKMAGMSVHADGFGAVGTLIANIQAYLFQKGEWNPKLENSFAPALCNRIDRNTSGLVIAAKNAAALRDVDEMIRSGEVRKEYLCIVRGTPAPRSGRLENYLFKDAAQNKVYVHARPVPGARKSVTLYDTVSARSGLTLLRCVLVTGRTHQIRAQLAAAGLPLLGDGKYGVTGRSGKEQHQALCSYSLQFGPGEHTGTLEYLSGRTFRVKDCEFVRQYFPETASSLFSIEG